MTKIRSPEAELKTPEFEDLANEFFDKESSVKWYLAVRAVEAWRDQNGGRYPD